MRHVLLGILGAALVMTPAYAQTKVGTAADEAAIQKIQDAGQAAYNKHDAKGIAALYAADADRATNTGFFSGRAEIEKSYADVFNGVGKNDVLKNDSSKVRFLSAGVAIADVDNTITGRTGGPVKNHTATIYMKRNGAWVRVAQRTIRMQ